MGILETEILIDSYNATLIHNQAVIEGLRGAGANKLMHSIRKPLNLTLSWRILNPAAF